MNTVLVTGASGFVGSNLARRLVGRAERIRCLLRDPSKPGLLDAPGVEPATGSLRDAERLRSAIAGCDVVFHVAGRTAALRPDDYAADNVEGTRTVAEACAAQSQPPTLVIVSSLAAGGIGTIEQPRREADPEEPRSLYGRSKLAAERAATQLADRVPLTILRPPLVFGPGDRAGLQLYLTMRWLPLHMVPGWRGFPMSLVDVRDLCEGLIRAAERGERAVRSDDPAEISSKGGRGVYYIGADRTITYRDFGLMSAQAAGWRVAALPLPRRTFWLAGVFGEVVGRVRGRPALVNYDKGREATAPGWVCDDAKIRRDLEYRPGAPLETQLAETVAWYRKEKWL